jgi:tRNA(Ile)-lysidine synthetase-like protein
MTPLFQSVVERVRVALGARCGVTPDTSVTVACSGGADSIALAHALAATGESCNLVALAFIDHGLRDVTMERQAALECAGVLSVPFLEREVRLPSEGNRQAAARTARYEALEQLAPMSSCIATGHTLTDQAETVLQRLTRGTGIRGLQGIHSRRGRWIRPLLDVSRDETRSLGFTFADDPTNATSTYQRNRLRSQVLPLLVQENPKAEAAIATAAMQSQDALELVDILVSLLGDNLDMSGFPNAWVHTLTRWAYRKEHPDLPPPRTRALQRLTEHLVEGAAKRSFSVGQNTEALADEGRLSFRPEQDPRRLVVLHGPGAYVLGDKVIKVSQEGYKGQENEIDSEAEVLFDGACIYWPLTFRKMQAADTIRVTGTEKATPLKERMQESGFSWESARRKNVLIDGLGRVLWVGPLGRTSIARPTEQTEGCVRVTISNAP